LESLSTFVDAQLEIVQRAREDISKLQELKRKANEDPQSFVEDFEDEVCLSVTGFQYICVYFFRAIDSRSLSHAIRT
jgi:hypothetical protein